ESGAGRYSCRTMTPPPSDPAPSGADPRKPAAPAAEGDSGPKLCAACGTYFSGTLCPKCVVGFAAQATGGSPPAISPYDKTVQLGRPTDRRPKSEPEIPGEALSAPSTARFGKFIRTLRLGAGGMGEVW